MSSAGSIGGAEEEEAEVMFIFQAAEREIKSRTAILLLLSSHPDSVGTGSRADHFHIVVAQDDHVSTVPGGAHSGSVREEEPKHVVIVHCICDTCL